MMVLNSFAFITLPGRAGAANCGATQFRWWTHVALPFTLPSRTCLHRVVDLGGREFKFSIHNGFDRLIRFPDAHSTWPSVELIDRREPTPTPPVGFRVARESLQSVASFVETGERLTSATSSLRKRRFPYSAD
jgi:hypothetical protein